jgi:hypothetical protein
LLSVVSLVCMHRVIAECTKCQYMYRNRPQGRPEVPRHIACMNDCCFSAFIIDDMLLVSPVKFVHAQGYCRMHKVPV